MIEKINSFYISGTKNIRPDLFNEFAEKIANSLAKISPNPKKPDQPHRNGVTSTQLRKLFDEVKRYERLIINDEIKNCRKRGYSFRFRKITINLQIVFKSY